MIQLMKLERTMFREYDVRGRESDAELNDRSVEIIARAHGTFLKKRGIGEAVVGHDNRSTSQDFYQAAMRGLRSTGVDVIGVGMCLTPMFYWSQYHFKVRGGVMVTSSHNPQGWNGLKLAHGYSATLLGEELEEVRRLAESEEFAEGDGTFREEEILKEYRADLLGRVKLSRPLKVVVNTANATASFFSPKILREFGCEVVEHNTDPDPHYPNYSPNPAKKEMIEDTGRVTVLNGADVGLAFDADGDRLGVTDEKGQVIWPDRWVMLLARSVLKEHPGAKIVFDVKVSEALPEDIRAHGGTPVMWKTGHSYIKRKMHEEGAPLAGEMSGHIFFGGKYYYGFDDANFAALKLLEHVAASREPLSEIVADAPYYVSTPSYHAEAGDKVKYRIVEELTEEFKKEGYRVVDINGARVYFNGGWGLVRASSNLPDLGLRFEAKTEKEMREIENVFVKKLSRYPEVAKREEWTTE